MTLQKKLEKIRDNETGTIRADVAETALYAGNDNEIKGWFKDLLNHGCVSGMISHLIYYYDTSKYFQEHETEIDDLRLETEEQLGEPLRIGTPVTNWLSWFAFEETAHKIAVELGLEI